MSGQLVVLHSVRGQLATSEPLSKHFCIAEKIREILFCISHAISQTCPLRLPEECRSCHIL